MELPKEIQPTSKEKIKLPARWFVEIQKANPVLSRGLERQLETPMATRRF
jgi:hypothetical protein